MSKPTKRPAIFLIAFVLIVPVVIFSVGAKQQRARIEALEPWKPTSVHWEMPK